MENVMAVCWHISFIKQLATLYGDLGFLHTCCHFGASRHECMHVTLYLWVIQVFGSSLWHSMSQNHRGTIYIILNFPCHHMIAVMTLILNVVL